MYAEMAEGFQTFLLVSGRIGGVLLGLPMFAGRFLPLMWRVGLVISLGALITMSLGPEVGSVADEMLLWSLAGEILAGALMGLFILLVFAAIQVAGQMIDVQMGFGIVNVVDPHWDQPVPLVGGFLHFFTILLFILAEGHHQVLRTLAWSFSVVPPGLASVGDLAVWGLMELAGWMFASALRLSLPVVGALFLVNLALGVLGRTMPQMNILVVGLPLKIIIGFIVLAAVIPFYGPAIIRMFDWMIGLMPGLWEVLGP